MTLPGPSTLVLLASLVLGAVPPRPAVQDVPPVRLLDDGARVAIDLADVSLESFLNASRPVLGVAMQWEPGEVAGITLHQAGVQRCDRAAFRAAFDTVLRGCGFLTWIDPAAPTPVIHVFSPSRSRAGQRNLPFTPPMLPADQLDAPPFQEAPLYTTIFALQHAAAADVKPIVAALVDPLVESIDSIDRSNQLLVVASLPHLRAVRDALAGLDVPAKGEEGLAARVTELEKQLADLASRLEALEAAGQSSAQPAAPPAGG